MYKQLFHCNTVHYFVFYWSILNRKSQSESSSIHWPFLSPIAVQDDRITKQRSTGSLEDHRAGLIDVISSSRKSHPDEGTDVAQGDQCSGCPPPHPPGTCRSNFVHCEGWCCWSWAPVIALRIQPITLIVCRRMGVVGVGAPPTAQHTTSLSLGELEDDSAPAIHHHQHWRRSLGAHRESFVITAMM